MHYSKKSILCLAATAMRSSGTRTVSAFMPSSSSSCSSPHAAFQIQTATRTGRSSYTSSAAAFHVRNGSSIASSSSAPSITMNLNRTARDSKSTLSFTPTTLPSPVETILIARKHTFSNSNAKLPIPPSAPMKAMLKSIAASGKATTFLPDGSKFTIIVLPDKVTRNNHPMSPHSITDSLSAAGLGSKKASSLEKDADVSTDVDVDAIVSSGVQIIVVDKDIRESIGAVAVAIARAMPVYTAKSLSKKEKEAAANPGTDTGASQEHVVNVSYLTQDGEFIDDEYLNSAKAVADGVRLASKLGDMPPAELNPETYSMQCRDIVEDLQNNGHSVVMEEIVGEELEKRGYGGIYGVGMAAMVAPRIVIMTYTPEGSGDGDMESIALCGKGVVYDTGGLSLKPKSGMPGMKHDMGGSAGVLCGFKAAVELKVQKKITLILGIVENAIGPKAVRNDDILTMYSGKTVEINNTDAEGRLVLADCVAHASKHIEGVDIILDMATLTGAQLVCTGKKHAGILAKTEKMEKRIFESGLKSGDLCYPMLYAPELLKSEFVSKVADMKNSVKDRGNAQASCAGHFIESHLDSAYKGDWVHVDMAGPDTKNDRATGYGVALVLGLLQAPAFY